MIKHIVMWKLDESYSEAEKKSNAVELKDKLLGLDGKIDELVSIAVYLNSDKAPGTNFDIMLDTEFKNFDDLNIYQVHEEHLKVVSFVKSLKMQRVCVDYEF